MWRRWTLRQQLTILTVLFLCSGGLALWLVFQVVEGLEGSVVARNQRELASANTRLIKLFWESRLNQSNNSNDQLDSPLQELSTEALSNFVRVEGGFYLLQHDRLLGYAFPTHGGPAPKKDVPPAERDEILQLARRATSQGTPQELVLHPKLDVLVLRADPLPLWGAVWTMKRMPRTEDGQQKILSGLVVVGILVVGVWTFAIALQLQWGVQQLRQNIQAMEANPAAQIPLLPAEMGILGTAINTMQSRRQQLEQRLYRVERLAGLGQLVAGVAHEIRNPLASIRLNLQYTDRQLQKQKITHLPIASLIEQVDRLEHLVQRLLYFDQNRQQETPIMTSFEAIVQESVALLRLKAEEQEVQLIYVAPDSPLPEATLRRRELGQVMVNLILNAIQASPIGKQVIVSVAQTEDAENQRWFIAWVEDQGSGLSDGDREHIFDPFYSTKPDGTGLGLAISHEIITRSGGQIDVQSQFGNTRFSIEIPIGRKDKG